MKKLISICVFGFLLTACAAGPGQQGRKNGGTGPEAGGDAQKEETASKTNCEVIKRTGSRTGFRVCK